MNPAKFLRNLAAALFLIWALGFVWFAALLPQPAQDVRTDAVIVPTGGPGRIARGLDVLEQGRAAQMLVTGVDPEVTVDEFASQFAVPAAQMDCCITLGFMAVDTRTNASETADWVARNGITSLRLVTTDWHMRRAAGELARTLPDGVTVVRDAVRSEPSLPGLFLEYHKLIASYAASLIDY